MSQKWCGIGLAAVALGFLGCGSNSETKSELSGKVSLNGETLQYGQVTVFNEKEETLATGQIIEGAYRISALPATGTVTLVVQTIGPSGEALGFEILSPPAKDVKPLPPDVRKAKLKELPEHARKAVETLTPVPLKYTNPKQSGLTVTLDGTAKTYNIEMTGKGERPKIITPIIK
jgi:hypothetical protein